MEKCRISYPGKDASHDLNSLNKTIENGDYSYSSAISDFLTYIPFSSSTQPSSSSHTSPPLSSSPTPLGFPPELSKMILPFGAEQPMQENLMSPFFNSRDYILDVKDTSYSTNFSNFLTSLQFLNTLDTNFNFTISDLNLIIDYIYQGLGICLNHILTCTLSTNTAESSNSIINSTVTISNQQNTSSKPGVIGSHLKSNMNDDLQTAKKEVEKPCMEMNCNAADTSFSGPYNQVVHGNPFGAWKWTMPLQKMNVHEEKE